MQLIYKMLPVKVYDRMLYQLINVNSFETQHNTINSEKKNQQKGICICTIFFLMFFFCRLFQMVIYNMHRIMYMNGKVTQALHYMQKCQTSIITMHIFICILCIYAKCNAAQCWALKAYIHSKCSSIVENILFEYSFPIAKKSLKK